MIIILKYFFRGFRYRYRVDPDEIKYIGEHLRKDSVAVDIGAHKGGYLFWMRRSIKKKGKIFAFEPQVQLYNGLKRIVTLLKYKNVTIENLGVSSEVGEARFFVPVTKTGVSIGARIGHSKNDPICVESKIQITSLDKYFYDRQIFPDLIKIDVEGHEKQILLGGTNLLKSCKPRIIMECEVRHLSDSTMHDVFKVLTDMDYSGHFYEKKKLKPVAEFNAEIHQDLVKGKWGERKKYINSFIFEVPENSSQ